VPVALVTGALGFIGRSLVPALGAAGWDLVTVDRRAPADRGGARWVVADLEREPVRERADVVVHLACPTRERMAGDPQAPVALAAMDAGVLEAARNARLTILAGSASIYGDGLAAGVRADELADVKPAGPYGRAKLEQEGRWRAALPPERLLVVRLFNLTGPGEPPALVSRAIAERLRAAPPGSAVPVKRSASVRDFLDIRDAVEALAGLARSTTPGTVNVCSGAGVTIASVADTLLRVSRRPVAIAPDGQGGESRSVGDPTLLRSLLDRRPRYTLEDSLRTVWAETAAGN